MADNVRKRSSVSNAERCKKYKEQRERNDPEFKQNEMERQRNRRKNRTPEQIERNRETARERMRRHRALLKSTHCEEKRKVPAVETRKKKEEKRAKWKQYKQTYRNGLSAQKKRRLREKDLLKRQEKRKASQSQQVLTDHKKFDDEDAGGYTPDAERKPIYRAKAKLPKQAKKYAIVVKGLIASATPRKRQAMENQIEIQTPNKKRRLDFCEKAIKSFKQIYTKLKESRKSKDIKQRKTLSSQLARLRKYRMLKWASSEIGIRYNSLLKWSRLDSTQLDLPKAKRSDALTEDVVEIVNDFYVKPTVSVTYASKKTVSQKHMKQKHTMNLTLSDAHQQFREENPAHDISFSKFASLKPGHVETVSKRKFRGCLCEKCTNVELQLKIVIKHLSKENAIKDKCVASNMTLCHYPKGGHPQIECIERKCKTCGIKHMKEKLKEFEESDEQTAWYQWETKKQMNEKTKTESSRKMLVQHVGSCKQLLTEFLENLENFSSHLFVAHWQLQQFIHAKEGLCEGEVLCVLDFAENMALRNQDECQSAHWFAQQVTIHPIVCYYLDPVADNTSLKQSTNENVEKTPMITHEFVFISDDLTHDAHLVECCVTQTLGLIQENVPVKRMIQFTDGCSSQYKSKTPFADISFGALDHNVQIERNFFGTSHGKGPADGCSGVVKSALTRALSGGTVLNSATDTYDYCKQKLTRSTDSFHRTFIYIGSESINRKRSERTSAKTISGTRKLHSVKGLYPGTLAVRNLSCCCNFCLYGKEDCPNANIVGSWKTEEIIETKHMKPKARKRTVEHNAKVKDESVEVPMTVNHRDIYQGVDLTAEIQPDRSQGGDHTAKIQIDRCQGGDHTAEIQPDRCHGGDHTAEIQPNRSQGGDHTAEINTDRCQGEDHTAEIQPDRSQGGDHTAEIQTDRCQDVDFKIILQTFAACDTFEELKTIVEKLEIHPLESDISSSLSIVSTGKVVDAVSMKIVPDMDETSPQKLYPALIKGDGNCLSRTGSVLEFGNEDQHIEIRVRIILELIRNEEKYLTLEHLENDSERRKLVKAFTMYSDHYIAGEKVDPVNTQEIYRKEVMSITKINSYMGIWQVCALASVLKCSLFSVYPQLGAPIVRKDLHRLIPGLSESTLKLFIMWTTTRQDMAEKYWVPNHFVPLIPQIIDSNELESDLLDVSFEYDFMDLVSLNESDDFDISLTNICMPEVDIGAPIHFTSKETSKVDHEPLTSTHSTSQGMSKVVDETPTHSTSHGMSEVVDETATHSTSHSMSEVGDDTATHSTSHSVSEVVDDTATHSTSHSMSEVVDDTATHSTNHGMSEVVDDAPTHSTSHGMSEVVDETATHSTSHSMSEVVDDTATHSTSHGMSEVVDDTPTHSTSHGMSEVVDGTATHSTSHGMSEVVDDTATHSTSHSMSEVVDDTATHSTSHGMSEVVDDTPTHSTSHSMSEVVDDTAIHSTSHSMSEVVDDTATHSTSHGMSEVVDDAPTYSTSHDMSEVVDETPTHSAGEEIFTMTPSLRYKIGSYVAINNGKQVLPAVVTSFAPLAVRYFQKKRSCFTPDDEPYEIDSFDIMAVLPEPIISLVGTRLYYKFEKF